MYHNFKEAEDRQEKKWLEYITMYEKKEGTSREKN
jgi:hypothetical protein